ncbi:SUF system Fe-S cluster assembly regulator [Alphaproteobacteria bacterium]|nr:SUF system Fe-S cluster assembly regulator [Alphaproteobacteria bacterium]MDB9870657.1 SUF system Fe-S cluster assembly regulator [Alphaproteobacteria bacterium]
MIKLNKMTDYAIVCLGMLARNPGHSMSATELSKETGLTLSTVQKLLKLLVIKSELIIAQRGSQGGYILNKKSSDISVVQIIEALDGPISITACVDSSDNFCEVSNICFLGGKWNKVNEVIRNSLNDISLDDLLNPAGIFSIKSEKEPMLNEVKY